MILTFDFQNIGRTQLFYLFINLLLDVNTLMRAQKQNWWVLGTSQYRQSDYCIHAVVIDFLEYTNTEIKLTKIGTSDAKIRTVLGVIRCNCRVSDNNSRSKKVESSFSEHLSVTGSKVLVSNTCGMREKTVRFSWSTFVCK